MDLSISIVSWNTKDILDQCLKSIYDTTERIDFEVIVVDNASTDGTQVMVKAKYPQVRLIENVNNAGFAKASNQAYEVSSGRHFLLLNSDTICRDGALACLVRFLDDNPQAGVVGPLVLNVDETLQYSWAKFPTFWSEVKGILCRTISESAAVPKTAEDVRSLGTFRTDWVGGCCMLVRRKAIENAGLMDENFFMYCEETDWCLRFAKCGWETWVDPQAEIVHLGGWSSKSASKNTLDYLIQSKRRYFSKHHGCVSSLALEIGLRCKRFVRTFINN
ncbi:MAG: glycosyltransferase family 2 protein [Armatimonadota bacterium]